MDPKREYRRMLEEGYEAIASTDPIGRMEYLSDYIFDFTTYDGEMAELFAGKALEVCAAISDSTTFDYIKDAEQYRWFLVMVNMPFFADKIEWGTSVRAAWWGEPPHARIKFDSCGLWLDNKQLYEPMEFTREQWIEFIAAVLAFGREEPKRSHQRRPLGRPLHGRVSRPHENRHNLARQMTTTIESWLPEARQIAAQCWCDDSTKHIEMIPELAEVVAYKIAAWMETGAFHARNEAYWRERAMRAEGKLTGSEQPAG